MPVHDWTRVNSGVFHDFHQVWSVEIRHALNRQLPKGFVALVEQKVNGPEPDVIAVETGGRKGMQKSNGTTAVLEPPQTKMVTRIATDAQLYARKANRIAIHHTLGDVVAIIEIVSPGNKDSRNAIRAFAEKSAEFLRAGVHLLAVDLFPPSKRDPKGIHQVIADEFEDAAYDPPADKPLTLVSYRAGYDGLTAYIEPIAVGDTMPDMALFLDRDTFVKVPLESTYHTTWELTPEPIRDLILGTESPQN